MSLYIALLRGINVSGHNLIKMAELKRMCEGLGLGRVQTYIQSGNVLFASDEEPGPLRQRIESEITAVFSMTVPVVLRTAGELHEAINNCPFQAGALHEGESLYVALLAHAPTPAQLDRLLTFKSDPDEYRIIGREIYLLYRQSAARSKLSNNFLQQKLMIATTTRNWQTMNKLAALADAMEVLS